MLHQLFDRTARRVVSISFVLTGIIIAAMVLGVSFSAIFRTLFNEPIRHVIEFSEYGLVFVMALGAAHIASNDAHVRVELIEDFLPAAVVRVLDRIAAVLTLLVACALAYAVLRIGLRDLASGAVSEGFSQIPRAPLLLTTGIGFFVFAVERLNHILSWTGRGREAAGPPPVDRDEADR